MKWEYEVISVPKYDNSTISSYLSLWGEGGWELVNILDKDDMYYRAIFKKPKESSTKITRTKL